MSLHMTLYFAVCGRVILISEDFLNILCYSCEIIREQYSSLPEFMVIKTFNKIRFVLSVNCLLKTIISWYKVNNATDS